MVMKSKILIIILIFLTNSLSNAQQVREITVSEVMNLVVEHNAQLSVSEKKIEVAKQQIEVAKLQQLPTITASTSQFYLGNSFIVEKDFSRLTRAKLPHYGSSYGIDASQLIYKGGLIKKSIEVAGLQEQISEFDYLNDQQGVKLSAITNLLEIYKIINQEKVYANNRELATLRLDNIKKFYEQGMITRNEVITGELAIINIDQGLVVLKNNKKILNYNLNIQMGTDPETELIPVKFLDMEVPAVLKTQDYYQQLAQENNPLSKIYKTSVEISQKNIEIINTDKYPSIAGFSSTSLNRPLSGATVLDMYSGGFQAGISVSYDIDNLFKTKKRLKVGQLQKEQAEANSKLIDQNINMDVNAAYIKRQNALENLVILEKAKTLAAENYKITEAKYLNQFAVQAEMTDAQNQKILSELDFVNAEIEVLFQQYTLLKTTGTL